jgi:hypothetical protein
MTEIIALWAQIESKSLRSMLQRYNHFIDLSS